MSHIITWLIKFSPKCQLNEMSRKLEPKFWIWESLFDKFWCRELFSSLRNICVYDSDKVDWNTSWLLFYIFVFIYFKLFRALSFLFLNFIFKLLSLSLSLGWGVNVVVLWLKCWTLFSKLKGFKLQLCYYIHFQTNALENFFIRPATRLQ